MVQNKALIFAAVPQAMPVAGEHLKIESRQFDVEQAPPAGGITVKNFYASFDPYQRGRMRDASKKSYSPPFALNEPITNSGVAKVIKSDNPRFQAGDLVTGMLPTEEYSVITKGHADAMVKKLENPYNLDPAVYIGALGMPGLTAYSSFYEIGKPVKGETILVSAASGAVGSIVGQLAKHEGLTVIGSVGDDAKLKYITEELGFDAGFNYKKEDAKAALARLAPKGVDIYYENVGGEQLEAALEAMNDFGRIVGCGMISQYNLPADQQYGVKGLMNMVAKRITFRGFIVSDKDMGPLHAKDHQEKVAKWISEGSFKVKMSVTEGIDNAAGGLIGLFKGENFGKAVLKIADVE